MVLGLLLVETCCVLFAKQLDSELDRLEHHHHLSLLQKMEGLRVIREISPNRISAGRCEIRWSEAAYSRGGERTANIEIMTDSPRKKALRALLAEMLDSSGATGAFVIDRLGGLVAGAGKPSPFVMEDLITFVVAAAPIVGESSKEIEEDLVIALPPTQGVPSGYLFNLHGKAALVLIGSPGRQGCIGSLPAVKTMLPRFRAMLGETQ